MNAPTRSRHELDGLVVNIELTLSSIIQGVALYFLTDNARVVLAARQFTAWPYVFCGLLVILLFWARSIIHTLTVIRWPLEFGHNFFYIACVLVEALAFTRLTSPGDWFALLAVFAGLVWGLFLYDLRMIRNRSEDHAETASRDLYAMVTGDQRLNLWPIIPIILVYNLGCAWAIHVRPDLFIARHGHLALIACEMLGLIVYLGYVIHSFRRLTPLVARTREEWLPHPSSES
ncbi:MAG: hypothetical protein H0U99_06530 [Chthoniobacterales bacterium]|nr:hypothetical protein [Chthoniobacterales bacterium]